MKKKTTDEFIKDVKVEGDVHFVNLHVDYCYDFPYKVYTNKEELLNEILK